MANRSQHKLTDAKIRSLIQKRHTGKYSDGNGLFLNVTDNKNASWVVRYSFAKKQRDIGIGSYTMLSAKEARERCVQIKIMLCVVLLIRKRKRIKIKASLTLPKLISIKSRDQN